MFRYNQYRSDSLRLQGYDYSSNGLYFLTICTDNHISFFGSVEAGIMNLSAAGKIAAKEWKKTKEIRKRVQFGEWVVMPNHIHGIICLQSKSLSKCRDPSNASLHNFNISKTDGRSPSLHLISNYKNQFGPQQNNISSIIRGFKSACTKRISDYGIKEFKWQSGFYDHIIRNQKSLIKIEQYIRENPYRWHEDRYHS